MGAYALKQLGLERGSFDLDVTHASPPEVQYSCIADGAAAATGASLGKLNLHWQEAPLPDTRTTYVRKSTGQSITLEVTPAFAAKYKDVPRPQLRAAGEEVMRLPDSEIFQQAKP
jgi:formylmethanofuran dehydrogenase subunit E